MPDASGGAEINLRQVGKRYGNATVIDRLSLDVRGGEFISLLGPSGCGKSTTLMMVAGFVQPGSGEILIGGRPVTHVPPHRRNVGMVFQNFALFPHMTVAENVGFALRQRGIGRSEAAQRVDRALDLVRLGGFAARYPQQLSGGQQQRVAIARAVIFNPPVLLMDEPLSALDKQLREEMQFEIKQLHDRLGITFFYVTHDQKEALVMSDRVVVMNGGRIEQVGAPVELYNRPANRFVASFIGEANFLTVEEAGGDDGGRWLRLGPHLLQAAPRGGGTVCMVRPEKIAIRAPGAAPESGCNALPGVVRSVVFMGELTRCVVELDGVGLSLIVKQQHRADVAAVCPGDRVELLWAVDDTLLVAEPGA